MSEYVSPFLFRRLPYYLSPQMDIYEKLPDLAKNQTVLEIGFGTGLGVVQYAGAANWVDALETDAAAVRFAKRVLPLPRVNWINQSIESWDATGGFRKLYGLIVMIEVLEHVADAKVAMERVSRLVSSGGTVVVTVPNALRDRAREEPLNVEEWTPTSFHKFLEGYFNVGQVRLVEADLKTDIASMDTNQTPIIGIC